MTDHPLVLVGPMTAQCASQAASQSPLWLQVIQATGAIATTVGVLIALYIAVIRGPGKPPKSADTTWHRWMHPPRQKGTCRSSGSKSGALVR
jgi:hypothetical protein